MSTRPPRRPGRSSIALLLAALFLGTLPSPGLAQPLAPATTAQPIHAPRPLSAAERQILQTLFSKVRPATLRILQCPPSNCSDPDGLGSGALISADGLALTAYHVVQGARFLSAQTLSGQRYAVRVIGYDEQHDLALLSVSVPKNTPYLPLARSQPAVGEAVLAVGNGNGAFLQSKTGRLTALDVAAGRADFPPGTLELNAPLVPGDSGGPILNAKGELTGIVSYIRGQRNGTWRAYAVPVSSTDATLSALKRGEKRDAPMIGIQLDPFFNPVFMMDEDTFRELSRIMKLGNTPGAFFTGVIPGSPAERAGLQALTMNDQGERLSGDLVTAVNGKRILNFSDFQYAVRAYSPGDTITLTVLRGTQTLQLKLTLAPSSQIRN